MRFIVLLFVIVAVGCGSTPVPPDEVVAEPTKPQMVQDLPSVEVKFTKFVLDNGLRVIVHEDRKNPLVAVNVWYHVGSKDERSGRTGFAHLFEHLMFQGSENFEGEYFEPLERVGATDLNGTTNRDRTNYFQTVPTNGLEVALWMESDRMGHFQGAITQERLDEQRGVVQNEMRQGMNRPYGKARFVIPPNTYPAGHPYSWTTIGSMEDLNAASLDDVKTWFKDYYGASNAVVVLAGDIDPDTGRKLAEKYFGHIQPGPAVERRGPWVARMTERREVRIEDEVPQERVLFSFNVPQYGTQTVEHLRLAAMVLGNGKNSRLYKRLVYEEQLATRASAYVWTGEIGSQFVVYADTRAGADPNQVEQILREEIDNLRSAGPTPDELMRAKMSFFSTTVSRLERVGGFGGKSDLLARSEVYLGNPGGFVQLFEWLRSSSEEQIRLAAEEWLGEGYFVLRVAPRQKFRANSISADRSKLPQPGAAPNLRLPSLERFTLSNGVKVVFAQRTDVPMVRFRLALPAGFSSDTEATLGRAKLAMDVLNEGTTQLSALELAAELERLGASISSGAGLDQATVSMSTLSTTLEPSLELFSQVIQRPAFSSEEIERRRKLQLAAIDQEKSRPFDTALRLLGPLVFGEHKYGIPLTGTGKKKTVESLGLDALVAFHKTYFRPKDATLVVVGNTTTQALQPLLESTLGSWKNDSPEPKQPTQQPKKITKPKVYLVDKPNAEQTLIVAGNLLPPRDEQDEVDVEIMNTVIGGSFMSRINMNLREDKHWSYGSRSFVFETFGPQMFGVYGRVQADKTKESAAEILKELNQYLGSAPVTSDELSRVTENKIRKLPGRNETAGRLLGSIAKIVNFGLPDDYFSTYVDRVANANAQSVMKAAAKSIRPDEMVWVIVGDLKTIQKPIEDLNLGEVQVVSD